MITMTTTALTTSRPTRWQWKGRQGRQDNFKLNNRWWWGARDAVASRAPGMFFIFLIPFTLLMIHLFTGRLQMATTTLRLPPLLMTSRDHQWVNGGSSRARGDGTKMDDDERLKSRDALTVCLSILFFSFTLLMITIRRSIHVIKDRMRMCPPPHWHLDNHDQHGGDSTSRGQRLGGDEGGMAMATIGVVATYNNIY